MGSASASGASTANLQQHHRPVEPALQDARDAAIQHLTAEAAVHDRLSYVDRFWALLNAGLVSFDDGEDVLGANHRASSR